jgi:hypothetical protein
LGPRSCCSRVRRMRGEERYSFTAQGIEIKAQKPNVVREST